MILFFLFVNNQGGPTGLQTGRTYGAADRTPLRGCRQGGPTGLQTGRRYAAAGMAALRATDITAHSKKPYGCNAAVQN